MTQGYPKRIVLRVSHEIGGSGHDSRYLQIEDLAYRVFKWVPLRHQASEFDGDVAMLLAMHLDTVASVNEQGEECSYHPVWKNER